MRLSISLACETSIRRVARGCCSFPLRRSVRSKRFELSFLPRNLLRTLTVRNPEFPFAEFGEHGKQTHSEVPSAMRSTSRGDSGGRMGVGSSSVDSARRSRTTQRLSTYTSCNTPSGEQRNLAVVSLRPKSLGIDRNGTTGGREPDHQGHDSELGRRNVIESWKTFLCVALARGGLADAVANASPISAEEAHEAKATDSPCIPTQVEDEAIALELRYCAAHVARNVHPKNARKHAYSDKTDTIADSRSRHHLIGHHNRTPLVLRLRDGKRRVACRAVSLRTVMS